jgi:hypothetical protein
MLSVVERARWRWSGVCFLLFLRWVFRKLIFTEREGNRRGWMPTGPEKSGCSGEKGWLDEGFLSCGENEWNSAEDDFALGTMVGVESGLVHRLKRGGGRAR